MKKIIVEDEDIFKSNDFITLEKEEFLYFYINHPNNITEIDKKDFSQKVCPFYQAFDYIQLLDTYTFDEFQSSNLANESFKNLSDSSFSFLLNQFIKSTILTSNIKLPVSVGIKFESSKVKSIADTISKSTTTIEFKPTIKTFTPISSGITSTFETSKNTYHTASTSFLFSLNLQNLDNSIVSKIIDTEHTIRQNRYTGPSFGKNNLKICSESKENEKSRCSK
ncbi:7870_t:CDS:2, partial [Dentiscutata heterogama]